MCFRIIKSQRESFETNATGIHAELFKLGAAAPNFSGGNAPCAFRPFIRSREWFEQTTHMGLPRSDGKIKVVLTVSCTECLRRRRTGCHDRFRAQHDWPKDAPENCNFLHASLISKN